VDKSSNIYMLIYAAVITIIVAVSLSFLSESLKDIQHKNEQAAMKVEILHAIGLDTVANPEQFFDQKIKGIVVNNKGEVLKDKLAIDVNVKAENKKANDDDRLLPLYIYSSPEGSKIYVLPMYGSGLWDDIWGYMAIQGDFNTVFGTSFGHKGETPGLGGEITTDWFQKSFAGKQIMDQGNFVSVEVKKGKLDNPDHQVQSITAATMTSNGVSSMIKDDVADYVPYFDKLKNQNNE